MFNDSLKVNIDGHNRLQIVPTFLLKVSFIEIHNSLGIDPDDSIIKEEKDTENNIIISDSTLRSLFPPQHDTMSGVFLNVVFLPKVYIPNYYHAVIII